MRGKAAVRRLRREVAGGLPAKQVGKGPSRTPVRPLAVGRPRLRVTPTVGMTVLIDCWPRCEGTGVQVDTGRETVLLNSALHGLFTCWWREILREVPAPCGESW